MKYINLIFLIFTLQSCAQNNELKKDINSKEMKSELTLENWKKIPCTKNRIATKKDVENGNAVFVIENAENKPYELDLPKLAYWNDSETKKQKLVVIIQIEETSQGIVTGYKDFDGNYGAGFYYEFKILNDNEIENIKGSR